MDEGIGDTFVSVGMTKGVHASVAINASGALPGSGASWCHGVRPSAAFDYADWQRGVLRIVMQRYGHK